MATDYRWIAVYETPRGVAADPRDFLGWWYVPSHALPYFKTRQYRMLGWDGAPGLRWRQAELFLPPISTNKAGKPELWVQSEKQWWLSDINVAWMVLTNFDANQGRPNGFPKSSQRMTDFQFWDYTTQPGREIV